MIFPTAPLALVAAAVVRGRGGVAAVAGELFDPGVFAWDCSHSAWNSSASLSASSEVSPSSSRGPLRGSLPRLDIAGLQRTICAENV